MPLTIADLTLPGKNGLAVAVELRAMEKTGKFPVLILSGTLVPLDEARFKASGARGVLFKPFGSSAASILSSGSAWGRLVAAGPRTM